MEAVLIYKAYEHVAQNLQSNPLGSFYELQRENLIKSSDGAALYEREFKTGNEEQTVKREEKQWRLSGVRPISWCQVQSENTYCTVSLTSNSLGYDSIAYNLLIQ